MASAAAFLGVIVATSARAQERPQAPEPKPGNDLKVIPDDEPYKPITGTQRIEWAAVQTFDSESLLAGGFTAAWGTAFNSPKEYGPHWDGFAKRYGMRFTGVASSNVIEAGLGALWGEDPRYVRVADKPLRSRIANVFVMSISARGRNGHLMPSYAKYIAIPGNNFLANTWRVRSESTTEAALRRTANGLLGEIASNAWAEFWPDVRKKVLGGN